MSSLDTGGVTVAVTKAYGPAKNADRVGNGGRAQGGRAPYCAACRTTEEDRRRGAFRRDG